MPNDEPERAFVPRERLAELLEEELEEFVEVFREARKATKEVRQQQRCPKCKNIFRGAYRVRDIAQALKAFELLVERVEGRPGTSQSAEGAGTFEFVNNVVMCGDDCPCRAGA